VNSARWESSPDPDLLLARRRDPGSPRRQRLLICAVARHVWAILPDEGRYAVEVAERLADGRCTEAERAAAFQAAGGDLSAVYTQADCIPAKALVDGELGYYLLDAVSSVTMVADAEGLTIPPMPRDRSAAERAAVAHLIRDVYGNPYHPVAADPGWRTEAAVGLARGMYDTRDFGPMPVLADALEDAGCTQPDVLGHCRRPGPHVRGCWVVDLVLGNS
jgi:hypothetical protein